MPPRDVMTIGAFSRRTRITVKALRLYDRHTLLTPSFVDPDSGYRYYRPQQIPIARLIEHLRRLDMPLQEIATVLDASRDDSVAHIAAWWDGVEQRIAMQRRLAEHLWVSLSGHHNGYPDFPCHIRDVDDRRIIVKADTLYQRDIAEFTRTGLVELARIAEPLGGPVGHPLVIYPEVVSDDECSMVELALPVVSPIAVPAGISCRHEAAHREMFTSITRASLDYPQILSAYDAVFIAMERGGFQQYDHPREIYIADIDRALPDDLVCEVAVPIT